MSIVHPVNDGASGVARRLAGSDAVFSVALTAAGTLTSLVATGWLPWFDNSLFHLPILGRLYDLPQFADDPFIQSLRHYASGLWWALAGSDKFIDPWWTLLIVAVLSRALSIFGFLSCAAALGVTERRQQIVFVGLLVSCCLLMGYSFAGGGGLFINYATHSEVANGCLLLSWSFAARGRFTAAIAFTGATFFCNAFMGVWNILPLATLGVAHLSQGRLTARALMLQCAWGAALAAPLAAPVLTMILTNPELAARPPVDYRDFLASYWPNHFLFESAQPIERLGLIVVIALGGMSLSALGRRAAPFLALFLGFTLLYVVGVAAPSLTGAPLVLNLHLLRSSAALQMIAALAGLSLATLWLLEDRSRRRRLGAALAATLCIAPIGVLLAPLVVTFERVGRRRKATGPASAAGAGPLLWVVLGAAVATSFALRAAAEHEQNDELLAFEEDWRSIGDWARTNTPENASFLTPMIVLGQPVGIEDRPRAVAVVTGVDFEYRAKRRVYTDFKRGAAVMWSPSNYGVWRSRADELLALSTPDARLSYAAGHGVPFMIDACGQGPSVQPVYRTTRLCVYASGGPA